MNYLNSLVDRKKYPFSTHSVAYAGKSYNEIEKELRVSVFGGLFYFEHNRPIRAEKKNDTIVLYTSENIHNWVIHK